MINKITSNLDMKTWLYFFWLKKIHFTAKFALIFLPQFSDWEDATDAKASVAVHTYTFTTWPGSPSETSVFHMSLETLYTQEICSVQSLSHALVMTSGSLG